MLWIYVTFLCVWLARAQITDTMLAATSNELACLDALSFDLCSNDASFVCPGRFYLNQYMTPAYQQQLFTYLVNQYVLGLNATVQWLLGQMLAQGDAVGSYSSYLDTTYGTVCGTDPHIQTNDLSPSTTQAMATNGREWWLLLLRSAEFCTENQIFVQGMGCVCKEDKNCDETNTHQYTSVMHTMIFVEICVLVIVLISMFVLRQHVQGLRREFTAVIDTITNTVTFLQNTISSTFRTSLGRAANNPTTPAAHATSTSSFNNTPAASWTPPATGNSDQTAIFTTAALAGLATSRQGIQANISASSDAMRVRKNAPPALTVTLATKPTLGSNFGDK